MPYPDPPYFFCRVERVGTVVDEYFVILTDLKPNSQVGTRSYRPGNPSKEVFATLLAAFTSDNPVIVHVEEDPGGGIPWLTQIFITRPEFTS